MDALEHAPHREALVEALDARFHHPAAMYRDRPMCRALRPRFIGAARAHALAEASALVLSAINKVERAIVADRDRLLPRLGHFGDTERRLLAAPVRLLRSDIQVRLDATATSCGWGFYELNGAIPGGLEMIADLADSFRESALFATVAERVPLRSYDLKRAVTGSLLRAWRAWAGSARADHPPTVALVDLLEGAPLFGEFQAFQHWMAELGLDCLLIDPSELSISGDRLTARGRAIDLVYRRLTLVEMLERPDETAALVAAAERDLALIIDPFIASVLDRKALFALLTDPSLEFGLTRTEREAASRTLPWTRLLRDEATLLPDGERAGLLEWVRRERERLILKPNHDFGGHGIHLGWRLDSSGWDAAIESALAEEYVVQVGIHAGLESFPLLDDPLNPQPFEISTDPYMFDGALGGVLCRLSTPSGLANITAGGGSVPVFVVDD
jgi:hypothetical protein